MSDADVKSDRPESDEEVEEFGEEDAGEGAGGVFAADEAEEGEPEDVDEQEPDGESLGDASEGEADGPIAKRPRLGRSAFVDDVAEVEDGDEDEEDEDEDGDVEGLIDENPEDIEMGGEAGVHMRFDEGDIADEIQRLAKQKEEQLAADRKREEGLKEEDTRLPVAGEDPKLFMVRCKPGKEQEVLINIMSKYMSRELGPPQNRMFITSAFTTPGAKGFIYVEAWAKGHVQPALSRIENVFSYSVSLIPVREMVPAITIESKTVNLRLKQFVRPKRGPYKGDLAQIVDIIDQQTILVIKIIPRIDYLSLRQELEEQMRQEQEGDMEGASRKRKRRPAGLRPPQKLFDSEEAEQYGQAYRDRHRKFGFVGYHWKNDFFDDNGFILKEMRTDYVDVTAVNPSLDELEKFKKRMTDGSDDEWGGEDGFGAENDFEIGQLQKSVQRRAIFSQGDHIRVVRGELTNLIGMITNVQDDYVMVMPENLPEITTALRVPLRHIIKHFELGTHVKVLRGAHKGETGIVTDIGEKSTIVSILSDVTSINMRAFAADVTESSERSAGLDSLGAYRVHDLVQNTATNEFCVVIRIQAQTFRLIDHRGIVTLASIMNLGRKRNSRYATAFDKNSRQLMLGDNVRVVAGEHQGRQGEIKHLHKGHLFMYNRMYQKTNGIFVTRARDCESLAAHRASDSKGQSGAPRRFKGRRQANHRELVGQKVIIPRLLQRRDFRLDHHHHHHHHRCIPASDFLLRTWASCPHPPHRRASRYQCQECVHQLRHTRGRGRRRESVSAVRSLDLRT